MLRRKTKTTNIFNTQGGLGQRKIPRGNGEPGFQGLIPRYFANGRPRMLHNAVPPYRYLYNKPSMQRVGKWLAAQNNFFKRVVWWREVMMSGFWFFSGMVATVLMLLVLWWFFTLPVFKDKKPAQVLTIVSQKLKIRSATVIRKTHRAIRTHAPGVIKGIIH